MRSRDRGFHADAADSQHVLRDLFLTPTMESKLAQYASLSQKDKAPAYLSLLPEILTRPDPSAIAADLHLVVDTVVNQESVGLVVGRQVLAELVKSLGAGAIKDTELRKRIVEDTLAIIQPRLTSYEEQVRALVRLSHGA